MTRNALSDVCASTTNEAGYQDNFAGLRQCANKDSSTVAAARSGSRSEDEGQNVRLSGLRQRMRVRPTLLQQMLRAALHVVQFAVAYFIMLLAMYFNGYIIICILIGAFMGAFLFSWDLAGHGEEVSGCCG